MATDPVKAAARQAGVSPALLRALVRQESGGNQGARSPAGAIGETQLMPGTARSLGVNPYNAQQNLEGGAKYLKQQLNTFHGNVAEALAAYNAGPGAVEKYGGVPPYAETQNYVKAIMGSLGGTSAGTKTGSQSQQPRQSAVSGGSGSDTTTTRTVGAVNHSKARGALIASFLEGADPRLTQGTAAAGQQTTDPLSFVSALKSLADVPGRQVTTTTRAPSSGTSQPSSGAVQTHTKAGTPVAALTSEGGLHQTEGLPGYPAHDYFAPAGSAAVAPVTGKVVRLSGHDPKLGPIEGPHGPLGWSVYIQGSDGKTYYLTHMGSRNVKVGETVRAGQQIGTVANYAKYGTPSHIHMGVHG